MRTLGGWKRASRPCTTARGERLTGARERERAIQAQIARRAMKALGRQIQHADHLSAVADGLAKTKVKVDLALGPARREHLCTAGGEKDARRTLRL